MGWWWVVTKQMIFNTFFILIVSKQTEKRLQRIQRKVSLQIFSCIQRLPYLKHFKHCIFLGYAAFTYWLKKFMTMAEKKGLTFFIWLDNRLYHEVYINLCHISIRKALVQKKLWLSKKFSSVCCMDW